MKGKIFLGIIIVLFIFGNILYFSEGEFKIVDANPKPTPLTINPQKDTNVKIDDLKIGTGREVKSGDTVVMQYKGMLTNGKEFDSSYSRKEPFTTKIGVGEVIKGWDQGIPGMKIGGKRKLTIPPDLAYGEQGAPPSIPPNSTLIFEVELLEIK
jgi:FKBP-type peptidyl-prolyl cis-trans isomerase